MSGTDKWRGRRGACLWVCGLWEPADNGAWNAIRARERHDRGRGQTVLTERASAVYNLARGNRLRQRATR
ncbi:unnamed protein product, partial [Iphiclides podalirius]